MLGLLDKLAGAWIDWRMNRHIAAIKRERVAAGEPLEAVEFKEARLTPLGADITLKAPGVAILADECAQLMATHGGPNYLEVSMLSRHDPRPIILTFRWLNGLTPHEKAAKLEAELTQIHSAVSGTFRRRFYDQTYTADAQSVAYLISLYEEALQQQEVKA